nr:Uncharacterised protein [Enterobacter mori]
MEKRDTVVLALGEGGVVFFHGGFYVTPAITDFC